jgi:5-methylcytosine-specific restriction endonuclease McrA
MKRSEITIQKVNCIRYCYLCHQATTRIYQCRYGDFFLCSEQCYKTLLALMNRVHNHRKKAQRLGHEATLTLADGVRAVQFFQFRCAYCGQAPFETIDHVQAYVAGGGTTAHNCVPACLQCNQKKAGAGKEDILPLFGAEAYQRLHAYWDYLATLAADRT